MIKMPDEINIRNASTERCDFAEGPCACGATHKLSDWPKEIQGAIAQFGRAPGSQLGDQQFNSALLQK